MPNHSHATIIGHLGKDPVSEKAGEHNVARFSVAVTRKRKSGDVTTWWNVTAWRQDAEYAARFLKKGDAVMVSGEPYLDEYEKDGQKRQPLKLEAQRVVSLSSRRDADPAKDATATATKIAAMHSGPDDDANSPPF